MPGTSGLPPGIPGKRCAHCNTQTTPLWRNGPDGPKTLCNACGVRDNRRHAKTRNAASRPRLPQTRGRGHRGSCEASPRRVSALVVGRFRRGRFRRAPIRAVERGSRGQQAKADVRRRRRARARVSVWKVSNAAAAAARARDDGPGRYHLHDGAREVEILRARPGFAPVDEIRRPRPEGRFAGRFAPGGPAPLYNATEADQQWLQGVNAPRAQSEHLLVGQLENGFDVFEEAGWHLDLRVCARPATMFSGTPRPSPRRRRR